MNAKTVRVVIAPIDRAILRRARPARSVQWALVGEGWDVRAGVAGWFSADDRELPLSDWLATETEAQRQAYVEHIGALSARYASIAWWGRCLAEKNPWASKTFFRVCCVRASVAALAASESSSPVVLLAADEVLRAALTESLRERFDVVRVEPASLGAATAVRSAMGWVRALRFVGLCAVRLAVARWYGMARREAIRRAIADRRQVTLVHLWVDARGFDARSGRLSEGEFGDVASYLERHGGSVFWLPRVLWLAPFRQIVRAAAESTMPVVIPEAFLTYADLLRAAWRGFVAAPPRWSVPAFAGVDISGFVAEDLAVERRSQRVVSCLLFAALPARLAAAGLHVNRIIYQFENHTWERLFCLATRRAFPGAAVVGTPPGAISRFAMNYFMSRAEGAMVPLPDIVVSTGSAATRSLRDGGYPPGVIVTGGALRLRHIDRRFRAASRGGLPLILVAGTISVEETADLLAKAVSALPTPLAAQIMVKCHPTAPFESVAARLRTPLPSHFEVTDAPLDELLDRADVMLYNSTSTCLAALLKGVRLVFVRPAGALPINHLDAVSSEPGAGSPEEIKDGVMRALDASAEIRRSQDVLDAMCGRVDEGVLAKFAATRTAPAA